MAKNRAQFAFELRHPDTKADWEKLSADRKEAWDRVAVFDAGITRYEDLSPEDQRLSEWFAPLRVSVTLPCKSCGGKGAQPALGIGASSARFPCPDCKGEGFGDRSTSVSLTIADFRRILGLPE